MPALRWPRAARPLNPAVMDEKDPVQRAIAALTDAALAATDNGGRERPDFGEIVCRVITHVAANLGSLDALLAGRPGSWEADLVRQIVESTSPEQELLSWRTIPVELILNPEEVLWELGVGQMYDDAVDAIIEEQGRDDATEERLDALDFELNALESLQQQDASDYATAYVEHLGQAAGAQGITVEIQLEVTTDVARAEPPWDELAERLHETARFATPLPGSGIAPRDYPAGQSIAETETAAGRTPRERLARP